MKFSFKFLFPTITLLLVILLLNSRLGTIPAIGKVFNPFTGVIQNENDALKDRNLELSNHHFSIYFDQHHIPHILATNENDMHFAQGFVTAKDRLWQMDFMSYAAAGRLSEILGADYLQYDRLQRRMGMLSSAKETLKFIESNPETKKAMDAYTEGVNQWIGSMNDADIPFEYKLMDYSPEPWTNLKSVLIMKYVGAMLTGYEEDISSSYMLAALGEEDFFKLYPDAQLVKDSLSYRLEDVMTHLPFSNHIDYSFLYKNPRVEKSQFNPRLGSNAWAVSAEKSENGEAMLCNDPHLNLTFPSIWYEIQLKSNERNVYGYSIPGTPGVIIGFNEHISWGVTSASTDVRDWYKLELKEDYSAYKMDGKWKKTTKTIEKIKVRDGAEFLDTIYSSQHGPIISSGSFEDSPEIRNYALRWALHDPTNEFLAILKINKSENYRAFSEAIKHFEFPAQNFLYADVNGNIGMKHQGRFFDKSERGDGKFILNGTSSEHLFPNYLKDAALPKQYNPACGYVYSANNNPWDTTNHSYINGYYSEFRANKLQSYFESKNMFSVEDMKHLQLNNTNRFAELALPVLLEFIQNDPKGYAKRLKNWNAYYELNDELATFFEDWIKALEYEVWDEIYQYDQFLRYPDKTVLLELIQREPTSKFFDKLDTDKTENAKMLIQSTFKRTMEEHIRSPRKWRSDHKINIMHLSQLLALSKIDMELPGHPNALNAISQNWGPSMRMIVTMGKRPKAIGTMAGGSSGNPVSKFYSSFLDEWRTGKYHEMTLYYSSEEAKKNAKIVWSSK